MENNAEWGRCQCHFVGIYDILSDMEIAMDDMTRHALKSASAHEEGDGGCGYAIYRLRCPVTLRVRYVGLSRSMQKRYAEHCVVPHSLRSESEWSRKTRWVLWLRRLEKRPILELIAWRLCKPEAAEIEGRLLTAYGTAHSGQLLNVRGPVTHTNIPTSPYQTGRKPS